MRAAWVLVLAIGCGKGEDTADTAPVTTVPTTASTNPVWEGCTSGTSWSSSTVGDLSALVNGFDLPRCQDGLWTIAIDTYEVDVDVDGACVRIVGGAAADEGHPLDFVQDGSVTTVWNTHLDVVDDPEELVMGQTSQLTCEELADLTFAFHALAGDTLVACAAYGADPSAFPDCDDANAW